MASGPYQSNLLRFFVGQYWQGLDRHRRAVRETRSTIALGGEIAAAAVLFPAVIVARASQKRLQTLKASATKLRLSLGRVRVAANLLDLSGFDRLSAVSARLNLQALKPLLNSKRVDSAVIEEMASEGGDAAVAKVAITEAVLAEAAMARTLLAVAGNLSPAQRDDLTQMPAAERPPLVRWWQSVRSVVSAMLRQQMGPKDEGSSEAVKEEGCEVGLIHAAGTHPLSNASSGLSTAGKITGVASDLETRSLVLVKDYRLVWKGLSSEQQRQLFQKIETLLADIALTMAEWQPKGDVSGEFALPSAMGLTQTGRVEVDLTTSALAAELTGAEKICDLAVPSVSFWVEVLRAVAWLQRRMAVVQRLPGQYLRLEGGASWLQEGRAVVARLEGVAAGGVRGGALVRRMVFALLTNAEGDAARRQFGAIFPRKGSAISHQFAPQGLARKTREKKALEKAQFAGDRDYIDASVVTAEYVEHPLEKLLNWVDYCLVWLETAWQRFMDFVRWRS